MGSPLGERLMTSTPGTTDLIPQDGLTGRPRGATALARQGALFRLNALQRIMKILCTGRDLLPFNAIA